MEGGDAGVAGVSGCGRGVRVRVLSGCGLVGGGSVLVGS